MLGDHIAYHMGQVTHIIVVNSGSNQVIDPCPETGSPTEPLLIQRLVAMELAP